MNTSPNPADDPETDFGRLPPPEPCRRPEAASGAPDPSSGIGQNDSSEPAREEDLARDAFELEPDPDADADADADAEAEAEAVASELAAWKQQLRFEFERWLSALNDIPGPDDPDLDPAEAPDLYAFFEQLAVLSTESRRSNRRAAEAFSQWGEALQRLETEFNRVRELATTSLAARGPGEALARSHCLALIEILDRLHRLQAAFAQPPPARWLARDGPWRRAWTTQHQAFGIVTDHLEGFLRQEGVTRLEVVHRVFDPCRMAAVAVDAHSSHPPQTVLEEITRGYLWRGELLRAAQVKISLPGPSATTLTPPPHE